MVAGITQGVVFLYRRSRKRASFAAENPFNTLQTWFETRSATSREQDAFSSHLATISSSPVAVTQPHTPAPLPKAQKIRLSTSAPLPRSRPRASLVTADPLSPPLPSRSRRAAFAVSGRRSLISDRSVTVTGASSATEDVVAGLREEVQDLRRVVQELNALHFDQLPQYAT